MIGVILLISVLMLGESFSLAEKNALYSAEKMRNRRDFQDFQTQITNAVQLDISNTSVCPNVPCVGGINQPWCPAFCAQNQPSFAKIQNAINACYLNNGLCGKNFTAVTLTNVNVSIATQTYNGKCYLYGQRVTMRLSAQPQYVQSMDYSSTFPGYVIYNTLRYDFTGLSVRCQPCYQSATNNNNNNGGGSQNGGGSGGGGGCCGNDLLTIVVCLVQNLLSSIGLDLNLLSCSCKCWGKRDVAADYEESEISERQAAAATAGFDTAVSLYTDMITAFNTWFLQDSTSGFNVALLSVVQTVNPQQVPAQYVAEVQSGIENVFDDYEICYGLASSMGSIVNDLTAAFKKTCTACSY